MAELQKHRDYNFWVVGYRPTDKEPAKEYHFYPNRKAASEHDARRAVMESMLKDGYFVRRIESESECQGTA